MLRDSTRPTTAGRGSDPVGIDEPRSATFCSIPLHHRADSTVLESSTAPPAPAVTPSSNRRGGSAARANAGAKDIAIRTDMRMPRTGARSVRAAEDRRSRRLRRGRQKNQGAGVAVLLRGVPLREELRGLGDEVLVAGAPVQLGARLLARHLLIERQGVGERTHGGPRLVQRQRGHLAVLASGAAGRLGDLADGAGGGV